MLNYIWFTMIFVSVVIAIFNGRLEMVTNSIITSSKDAIEMCIELLGIMCLWLGIMRIADKAGVIEKISSKLRPITKIIFKKVPSSHPAMGAMIMNIVANFMGLGNAATPLGLKAMNELQKLNNDKRTATDPMCMFLVINTCSVQLIPATLIAIRSAAGSNNPTLVIGPIWVASVIASLSGIIVAKLMEKKDELRWK